MKNLIFDYDGTLHDCLRIYEPAFRKAYGYLVSEGYVKERNWTAEEIGGWLGFSAKDMWNAFAPELPEEVKKFCSRMIGDEMLRLTECGKVQLYPGAVELLRALKEQGYRLIFLSNCKRKYMDAHKAQFGLERFFAGFYCTEDFGWKPKTEIFPAIRERFDGDFVMIGDRFHDMEVAEKYGLKAIGCAYGYGEEDELLGADFRAGEIGEILEIVIRMKEKQDGL